MSLPAIGADPAFSDAVSARLAEIEAELRESAFAGTPFVTEAATHIIDAGGKRFRPMLVTLATALGRDLATLGGPEGSALRRAALVCELTHVASLYHDDVMDEADMRRAVVSANAAYGNSTAILVGDLLFGTASRLLAGLGPDAVRIQAETFVRLCSGQIRDDQGRPPGADPEDFYLGVLADKTGVLIATAARYGAMFSGCNEQTCAVLEAYGERLGVAFQLADDILDITSEQSGKEPGTDLREGVDTLPIIYVKRSEDPADAELRDLLARDLREDDEAHARALTLLRSHPALDEARAYTRRVAEEAQQLLAPLGDGPAVTALQALAASVVDREV